MNLNIIKTLLMFAVIVTFLVFAQEEESPPSTTMTGDKLNALIALIDPKTAREGNTSQFIFQDRLMLVVFDEAADRMRMFSPIGPAGVLEADQVKRMLQANFDSALDARYALANNLVWSIFIHPLSPLQEDEFASAVVQVYNVAESFGGAYTSGLFTYGGGDSVEENRKLLEELKKRINPTT
jgi:hypothetical protein